MIKRLVLLFVVVLVMIPSPAVAQEADIPVADLEPLATIIDTFASTDDFGDLFISNEAAEATVLSQFQILVNMGRDPAFGEEDVELVFSGVTTGDTPELVSVEEYFQQGATFRMLPPLAPFEDRSNGFDPTTVADGWLVFGEEGPIEEGSPIFFEQFQTVWGIELAEPFDTACSTTSYVGRAWNGASVTTGPDPLFTEDAVGADHAALAGATTRYAELACFGGGDPMVTSRRMKEGAGSRIFGPTGTIALVKDRFVVFFSPVRIYDGDLSQFFYASPPEGGPVEVSNVDAPIPLLVPNPYEELNSRLTIVPSTAEGSSFSDEDTGRTLLHAPDDPTAIAAQSSGNECLVPGDIFVNDLAQGAAGSGFLRDASAYTTFSPSFGVVDMTFTLVTGSEIVLRWDLGQGVVVTRITTDPSNASAPFCTRSDAFLVDGESTA
ncbi:MAG: hypothetical protein M3132_15590, partial [Actinomycetia bacterium]|nr:hypothetical protein [Actinomycetes bacterium]